MNLQRSNYYQKAVVDYNDLVIDYQCLSTLKFKFKCEESHPFTQKALCNRLHWFGNRLPVTVSDKSKDVTLQKVFDFFKLVLSFSKSYNSSKWSSWQDMKSL